MACWAQRRRSAFFIKPLDVLPPPGVYTDQISIDWTWNLCPGIGLLGLCIGITNAGTGSSVITVTLIVSPQNIVVTMSGATTWDPGERD